MTTKVYHRRNPVIFFIYPCLSVSHGVDKYVSQGSRYWMLNLHWLFWSIGVEVLTMKP